MFYTDNHFSGREQVGMDWHLLGNGVAVLGCAWFRLIGAKGLRKLPASSPHPPGEICYNICHE